MHKRQVLLEVFPDFNVVSYRFFLHKPREIIDQLVDIHFLKNRLFLPSKVQQVLSDLPTSVHLAQDFFQGILQLRNLLWISFTDPFQKMLHPLRFLGDDGKGIVDFMSNPC